MREILKNKKFVIIGLLLLALIVWYQWGRRLMWQVLFASKNDTITQTIPLTSQIELLSDFAPQVVKFDDYDVEIKFRAKAQMTARVVYVDYYDSGFYLGKKTLNGEMKDLYNTVSPLDITILQGKTAEDGNWQKFKLWHEYRTFFYQYKYADRPYVNNADFSNLHILPATNAIRRGMDTLKVGEFIRLDGWLIDWRDLGKFKDYPYQTAQELGQIADFKLGGKISGLCFYFYVTQMFVDGYLYQ